MIKTKRTSHRTFIAILLTCALLFSPFLPGFSSIEAFAAPGTVTVPYFPWSQNVSSTGDYFVDLYSGVESGHVFENVTTDRLIDIVSGSNTPENSSYYIVFAGPEHRASQKIISKINELALAAGITKIYHFDPYVDGFQLDSTLHNPLNTKDGNEIIDITGGVSVNYGPTAAAKLSDVWRIVTDSLPSSASEPGGALYDYDGKDLLLLSVEITDRGNPDSGKRTLGSYKLTDGDANTVDANTQSDGINAVFSAGGSSAIRSEWDFFKRLYNGSATYTETHTSSTSSADRYGAAVTIFDEKDFAGGNGFVLDSIDVKELFNLLNSPGEFPILFAGQGCHNTQAIIASVAKRAKELNIPKVYVADFALDSNVKFGTGNEIDKVLLNSATGGLWIRSSTPSAIAPYRYGYSYLYGELVKYFGGEWITENSSKRQNSVAYYLDAVIGGQMTKSLYDSSYNSNVDTANAKRLQVPTIIRYNKDKPNPVVAHWIHPNQNAVNGLENTYTEYMLELSWVRATPKATADKTLSASRDGLTKVEFASEAVAALDNVLRANTNIVHRFTSTPFPTIKGEAKIGETLSAYKGDWSHTPDFTYQWYADGKVIASATKDTYATTAADAGKRISVSLTGTRLGYAAVTRTSDKTAQIGIFTNAPIPTIKGKAKVGTTLGIDTGSLSALPKDSKFAYQWYASGKAISKATADQLKLTKSQTGKIITVSLTVTAPGYVKTTKVSKQTSAVTDVFKKTPVPKITGTAKAGKKLKVNTGTWSPKPKFTYQWYAGGKAIKGATKSSLKLKKAQRGKKISVKVTGTKKYYSTVTKTSRSSAKVK